MALGLYFAASDGQTNALWKAQSDGSIARQPEPAFVDESPATVFDGNLYLTGFETYALNGTGQFTQVTFFHRDLTQTPGFAVAVGEAAGFNGELYLAVYHVVSGLTQLGELWKVKADHSVVMVRSFGGISGHNGSAPINFFTYNGELYYDATEGQGTVLEKVKPDGTIVQVTNGLAQDFLIFNNEMYFGERAETFGNPNVTLSLSKIGLDGSVVTITSTPGTPANADPINIPHDLASYNGELYFGTTALQKMQTGGTIVVVANDLNPTGMAAFNGELYFSGNSGATGVELMKLKADGSVVLAADINPGAASSSPAGLTVFNNELYFSANNGIGGTELWKVKADGSVVTVADINAGPNGSNPSHFILFNGPDVHTGGPGAQVFAFEAQHLADAQLAKPVYDRIVDYDRSSGYFNPAEGDTIDLSALLSIAYNHGSGQLVGDLVRIVEDPGGTFALLQVDTDGLAGGAHWTSLARLDGLRPVDFVKITLDGSLPAASVDVEGKEFAGDFNHDAKGDMLWRNDNGAIAVWLLNGAQKAADVVVSAMGNDWHSLNVADFNGDGSSDLLWRHDNGTVAVWLLNGGQKVADQVVSPIGNDWHYLDTADFSGDGKGDILWRHDNGTVAIWLMNGTQKAADQVVSPLGNDWHYLDTADFSGDGKGDILLRHDNGSVAIWLMNGTQKAADEVVSQMGNDWHYLDTADFNGDGKSDILWRNDNGTVAVWLMNGTQKAADAVTSAMGNDWHYLATADFNGDGKADILWQHDNGGVAVWLMNGTAKAVDQVVAFQTADARFAGTEDLNGDGQSDILWRADNGDVSAWLMNGTQKIADQLVSHIGNDWVLT